MKRNGKNIISSSDITIEEGTNAGKSLKDVLESQDKSIDQLRSNVKWIYKYGGVGSGGSGGGGSSSWSISARLGGQTLSNNSTIVFSNSGTYQLYIHINNPGGDSFLVTYIYTNNDAQEKRSTRLNQDNGWTLETNITISGNSIITISAMDGNAIEKSITTNYITSAYTIYCFFSTDLGERYNISNDTIFISAIQSAGLKVAIKYYLATTSIGIVSYTYTNFNGSILTGEINSSQTTTGTILLDAFDNIEQIDNNSAGNYTLTVEFRVGTETITKTLTLLLIPENLYLRVIPETGKLFQNPVEDVNYSDKYPIGRFITYITPFHGRSDEAREYRYRVILTDPLGEIITLETTTNYIKERTTSSVEILVPKIGEYKIDFILTFNGEDTTFTYYAYTKDVESKLNWYPDEEGYQVSPFSSSVYRHGLTSPSESGFIYNSEPVSNYITMFANGEDTELFIKNYPSDTTESDCMICIGIQYSPTNNKNNPILSIQNSTGTVYTIFQNKITDGATTIGNIYLPPSNETYGASEVLEYHLITIYRRLIKYSGSSAQSLSELCIYIDGVLESAKQLYITTSNTFRKIILHPSNYFVNLLEVSYFGRSSGRKGLSDANIVRYWYTYNLRIQNIESGSTSKESLLREFEKFELTEDNHVKVNSTLISNIAAKTEIPILVIKYDEAEVGHGDENIIGFLKWSDTTYSADSKDSKTLTVGVAWSEGNGEGLKDINVNSIPIYNKINPDDTPLSGKFTLDIQGSTTRTYHSKNYTLSISKTDQGSEYQPLFSPNLKKDDSNTFLPEAAFTLKADVVDSSHSNNTSIGAFINDNTTKFIDTGSERTYGKFVKNCLIGFPILMFVEISNADGVSGKTENYYLGIYNFNLGRDSYYNLGYYSTNSLPADLSEGFVTCAIPKASYTIKNGFIATEISNNDARWDFSQFHDSILFSIGDNDKWFMFDDTVRGGGMTNIQINSAIQNFVKNTAFAGGYIFKELSKKFDDINFGYKKHGSVPNVAIQYERSFADEGEYKYEVSTSPGYTESDILSNLNSNSLINYVVGNGENNIAPYVNFNSLVEYYTVCMAFGLLDSVQKNLNIKSWNYGATFNFAFYDMDTCLGIDNNGVESTYFAFSDFWKEEIESSEIITEEDGTTKVVQVPTTVKLYRDYFNKDEIKEGDEGFNIVGYDVPSSYAFCIAKYAKAIDNIRGLFENNIINSPQNLWSSWRRLNKPLENANKFIDEYFSGHMEGVSEAMFNYNYRQKYLLVNTENTGFNAGELGRFKGRRTFYVRDWLSGRFHILDAYFNILRNTTISITDGGDYVSSQSTMYSEAYPDEVADSFNSDIYIIRDIFGANASYSGNLDFIVQAPEYSPLIISRGDNLFWRYLLKNPNNYYNIKITSTSGNNKMIFGGSPLWTYLNSINSFCGSGLFSLYSNNLTSLIGDSGSVNSWDISMPALQDVKLNSSGYSGSLTFRIEGGVNKFPNLTNIDISRSHIDLVVEAENIKAVDLSGISSQNVYITDCSALTSVVVNNTSISNTCSIRPVWSDEILLQNNKIRILNLSARANDISPTITIKNDSILNTLTLEDFKVVTINDCKLLTTAVITGSKLEELTITSSNSSLTRVTVNASNLKKLNLSGNQKLTELIIQGDPKTLEEINLSGTRLKTITYSNVDSETDYPAGSNTKILDLSPMTGLIKAWLGSNSFVEYIKFTNFYDKPVSIKGAFKGCGSLRRVFGHIKIDYSAGSNSGCFQGLPKFTIHGENLNEVRWKGQRVVEEGIIKMPLEILFNMSITVGNTLKDQYEFLLSNAEWWWQDGQHVTNIQFKHINSLQYFCDGTPCTQFDIYYTFNMLAVCSMNGILDSSGGVSCRDTFYIGSNSIPDEVTNSRFNFGTGNQPNRYMFFGCNRITSLSRTIYCSSTKLVGPEHNGDEIQEDNGLFSPLTGLTTLTLPFNVSYMSRFILRRKNGDFNNLGTITYFSSNIIYDDVDLDSFDSSMASGLSSNLDDPSINEKMGNFTDFFKNIPSLGTLTHSLCPTYINYDSIKFPTTGKSSLTFTRIFNSTYGKGTIDIQEIFENIKSKVEGISNSFRVSSVSTSYNTEGTVNLPIDDNTLKGFNKLKYLGYVYIADGTGGTTDIEISSGEEQSTITGFNGNGIFKYINQSAFPYAIFNDCKNSLENCPGFFQGINRGDFAGESFYFPYNMFTGCTKLRNVASFLENCKIPCELTSEGFANCPNLENVSRLFYFSRNRSNNGDQNTPSLSSIPIKFFYHGHKLSQQTYWGTNNEEDMYVRDENEELTEELISYEDFILKHPNSFETVSSVLWNSNISYAYQTFCGCSSIKKYISEIDSVEKANALINRIKDNPEYINRNYKPFKYIVSPSGWSERTEEESKKVDISRIFDGNHENEGFSYFKDRSDVYCKDSSEIKDRIVAKAPIDPILGGDRFKAIQEITTNYFCPPDIFDYMKNSSSLNIKGFFKNCGSGVNYLGVISSNISGRICPYFLSSVSEVSNLNELFRNCKGIIGIEESDGRYYPIPKNFLSYATKITSLANTFSGMMFAENPQLRSVLLPLSRNVLNINGIFSACRYTTENTEVIESLFDGLKLTEISGAFSNRLVTINASADSNGRKISVDTSNVAPRERNNSNISFSNNFPQSSISNVDNRYVWYLYFGYVQRKVMESAMTDVLRVNSNLSGAVDPEEESGGGGNEGN